MLRIIVLSFILIVFACSDSTGPSFSQSISGGLDFGSYKNCLELCLNDQGTELYTTSSDEIFIIDISSLTITDEGGVLALDMNTLAVTDSLDLAYQATGLCYVPVLDILYIGIAGGLFESGIMVVDLPGLVPSDEIEISPWLMDMAPDPSGDYVYCSIEYGVDL